MTNQPNYRCRVKLSTRTKENQVTWMEGTDNLAVSSGDLAVRWDIMCRMIRKLLQLCRHDYRSACINEVAELGKLGIAFSKSYAIYSITVIVSANHPFIHGSYPGLLQPPEILTLTQHVFRSLSEYSWPELHIGISILY